MNNEDRPHFKKKRKLSSYMCQELLYDYLSGQLDEDRNTDVKDYLKESDDCHIEKDNIEFALDYCNKLADTEISQPLKIDLIHNEFNLYKYIKYINWKTWPSYLRWSAQAFIVSLIVSLIAIQFPWMNDRINKLTTTDKLILARISKPRKDLIQKEAPKNNSKQILENKLAADQKVASKKEVLVAVVQKSKPKVLIKKNSAKLKTAKKVKNTVDAKKSVKVIVVPKASSSITDDNSSDFSDELIGDEAQEESSQKAKVDGQLFRVYMVLNNVNSTIPKVVAKIRELGGKKAGRVEIGLRKKEGAYFHFILPELNETTLYSYLKSFGAVKVYEKKHKRVMKDGKRRYILWIQDLKR
jgi:hypothetical protein